MGEQLKPLTIFDRITESPEVLARFLRANTELTDTYCKCFPECEKALDNGCDTPEGKCRQCLVDWLNQQDPEGAK